MLQPEKTNNLTTYLGLTTTQRDGSALTVKCRPDTFMLLRYTDSNNSVSAMNDLRSAF